MKKFLFIDIDGVMTTISESNKYLDDQYRAFNPEAVQSLNKIVGLSGCDVILTTSWRRRLNLSFLKEIFIKRGFNFSNNIISSIPVIEDIAGATRYISTPKGIEIKEWLLTNYTDNGSGFKVHGIDFTYVIIDDEIDMLYEQKDNFINTNFKFGLCSVHVDQALKILNGSL